VAVASAGPYASLHLAPDCQYPTTQFITGHMPFLPPNQQRQSTEGTATSSQADIFMQRKSSLSDDSGVFVLYYRLLSQSAANVRQRLQTHYEVLGLGPSASQMEIRSAFLRLSKQVAGIAVIVSCTINGAEHLVLFF